MKQSGQKSKLCVTLIACFITSSGKIFCIFSHPSTYILHVAKTDVAISEWFSAPLLWTLGYTRVYACLVLMLRISLKWPQQLSWLARLTSTQTTRVRFPMVAQEKKIYFLAAFQCFGGHCKPSGQSAQSLSSSCFL